MNNLLAQVDLGKIKASGVPTAGANPTAFVASLVRNSIWLLVIAAVVIGLVWMIFAGYSFIFAGDDSKKVASSWSKIYWILIGLVIIVGSFAIIRLAETFFNVDILSGGLKLQPLFN